VKTYDAIVVGGGIIGGSIALALAREKQRVLVLDRAEPGKEASWAAAGMLAPAPENYALAPEAETTRFIPFAKASFALYPRFIEEIESLSRLPTGYRRDGTLEFFFGPLGEWERTETLRVYRQFGVVVEPISTEQARARAPVANGDAVGAAWVPDECTVDPRLLTPAVLGAAKARGAVVRQYCAVEKVLTPARDGAVGVVAGGEEIQAANVVIAAGCFSSQIPEMAQFAPTSPCRGQMIALQFDLPDDSPVLRSQNGYIVPRRNGRVVVGSTLENAGYAKHITPEGMNKILNAAAENIPALANAPILEKWAGLRPDTPDHLPIIGATGVKGLWMATGHYRNGILLAPGTATAMAGLILHGKSPIDIGYFSPLRFEQASGAGSLSASADAHRDSSAR
jgi:glycine oxidase